jgi:hypothetical protein
MSAHQATNTDTVVYVRLLDEGTDVWRPVAASVLSDGVFQLAAPDYDPETENWEFPPTAKVTCAAREFADGKERLVVIGYAS